MSRVNYQQLSELHRIVRDHTKPMATRMSAKVKYDKIVDEAVDEAREHMKAIKAKANESVNVS